MDYTIIGGEVNLAARLEHQADPGGILLSYETYALVRDLVEAEEQPSIEAKGIRREIRPFALRKFPCCGRATEIHSLRQRWLLDPDRSRPAER